MDAYTPTWEQSVHRFLHAAAKLHLDSPNGPTVSLWTAIARLPDDAYPLLLDDDHLLNRGDLILAAFHLLQTGEYFQAAIRSVGEEGFEKLLILLEQSGCSVRDQYKEFRNRQIRERRADSATAKNGKTKRSNRGTKTKAKP